MASEQKINYTEAQTAEIVRMYKEEVTVEKMAELTGRTTRSIIAKLTREQVYVPKARSTSANSETKVELIQALATTLGIEPKELESLEKATKGVLQALIKATT